MSLPLSFLPKIKSILSPNAKFICCLNDFTYFCMRIKFSFILFYYYFIFYLVYHYIGFWKTGGGEDKINVKILSLCNYLQITGMFRDVRSNR